MLSKYLAWLAILGTVTMVLSERRFEHGEKCTPSEDWCNYGKWMFCRKGLCECLHPARQVYDKIRDRCVGAIDKECNVYIGDRDCISNAFCQFNDGKGSCKCMEGFYASSGNTCVPTSGAAENAVEPANARVISSNGNSPLQKFLGSQFRATTISSVEVRRFKLLKPYQN